MTENLNPTHGTLGGRFTGKGNESLVLKLQCASKPPRGLLKTQMCWVPPLEFLTQRVLGCVWSL